MRRSPLISGALLLVLIFATQGCSAATTSTSTTSNSGSTHTTRQTVASVPSGTTSTTQLPAVWQTVRYEQDTPGLLYSGPWTYSTVGSASQGGFVFADAKGASLTLHFVGSYCGWLAKTANLYGKAKVTVDGGSSSTVDLYSKDTVWCHIVWQTKGLPFGEHTVTIEWTGKKRTGAKGTRINVDAMEIMGALVGRYQQTDPHFKYSGKWATSKDASAAGGSFALTKSSQSSVTVQFTGIQIDWFAKKGPAYGQAQLVVDGGEPVTVDLYGADALWDQDVWSSGALEMGPHVVTISWTGAKDANATGTYINVDEFEIAGAAE